MNDITTSRNINTIVPVSHFGGITPICVPMEHDSSFSDEVTGRFSQRVGSLWDRLGLVFLIEDQQAPVRDNVQHVVNNFSSQIIFQLFSNKNTRRLVEKDQPGFVYLGNILKQYDSRQRSVSEQISREISERIADTDKLAQHVKSIYGALCGDDKSECSAQLLTITLEKLLRERIAIASDKSVISENKLSETEVVLIERLQKTLRTSGGSDNTRETRILEQLSKAADMENASESRKELLSVISEYIPKTAEAVLQQKAADIVSSAVGAAGSTGSAGAVTESNSIEGVRKNLAQEIDRLNRAIFDDGVSSVGNGRVHFSDSREAGIQAAEQRIRGSVVAPVTQGYDITRSVTELLQSTADDMASDKTLTAQQRLISSFSGKSIEEIEKLIRTVYEATPKKTGAQAGKVIAAASDVVLSLLARRADTATDAQMNGMVTGIPSTRYSIPVSVNNTAVMHDKAVYNAASSTYFTYLSSGVEQFYNIDQGDAQGISYREIKRTVSELMKNRSAHATAVKSAAPLNRILHTDKATGFTVAAQHQTINNENNYSDTAYAVSENNYRSYLTETSDRHVQADSSVTHTDNVQNVTVNGTVLPAEQNSYTLNRSDDTYYAEHHHDGEEHNTSNTSVTNNISTDRTVNNVDNVQNVRNVTVKGTVLSAVQNSYTLNRSGDTYYAEHHHDGEEHNTSNTAVTNNLNTDRTVNSADNVQNVRNVTVNGTVLPAEQNSYTLNRSGDTYYAEHHHDGEEHNSSNTAVTNNLNTDRTVNNFYNVQNVRNVTVNGTVLPAEQNSYTLNRSGDTYYAEHHHDGEEHNTSNTSVTNNISTDRTVNNFDHVQNVRNVTVNGTVLPAEQNSYTLNRSGDTYYAEHHHDGEEHNTSNTSVTNNINTDRTVNNADNVQNVRNVTVNGTVLPAEQNSYTLNRSGDTYYAEQQKDDAEKRSSLTPAATGSYRSRLDSKTLAALDEIVKSADIRRNTGNTSEEIKERYTVRTDRSDVMYEYVHADRQGTDDAQARSTGSHRRSVNGIKIDRIQMNQLRTAAVMRRGVGLSSANGSAHIASLIDHITKDAEQKAKGGAVNSSFSYRTIDSSENMVMLIPPTEMDRYQAESGYAKQMPPIDLKKKEEPEQQTQSHKKPKTVNSRNESVTVSTMGSIEGMSRAEINKLVDKVYEQLEARLLRERRRHGL